MQPHAARRHDVQEKQHGGNQRTESDEEQQCSHKSFQMSADGRKRKASQAYPKSDSILSGWWVDPLKHSGLRRIVEAGWSKSGTDCGLTVEMNGRGFMPEGPSQELWSNRTAFRLLLRALPSRRANSICPHGGLSGSSLVAVAGGASLYAFKCGGFATCGSRFLASRSRCSSPSSAGRPCQQAPRHHPTCQVSLRWRWPDR